METIHRDADRRELEVWKRMLLVDG